MGLLSFIVTLPLAPVRGVISLAELIQRQVEEELHDPATARRALEELDDARAAGEISAEEEEQAQQAILDRMTATAQPTTRGEGVSRSWSRRSHRHCRRRTSPRLALRDITAADGQETARCDVGDADRRRVDRGSGGCRGSAHPVLDGHAGPVRGGVGYGRRVAVLPQNPPLQPRRR